MFSLYFAVFCGKSRARQSAEGLRGLVCLEKINVYMELGRFERAEAVFELKRQLFGLLGWCLGPGVS